MDFCDKGYFAYKPMGSNKNFGPLNTVVYATLSMAIAGTSD